jgi:hypothetical protein
VENSKRNAHQSIRKLDDQFIQGRRKAGTMREIHAGAEVKKIAEGA